MRSTLQPDTQALLSEYKKTGPKIHFSPTQQFYPKPIYGALMAQEAPSGKYLPLSYTNATEEVYSRYGFPYPLYDYQRAWVDAFAVEDAAGMYFEIGAGKTSTATAAALYHRIHRPGHTLVLMPPILIRQWNEWLKKIKGINSVTMYKGTPSERKNLDLDAEFVLMSMDIFKRDFDRIYDYYLDRNVTLIVDEAVSVKNPTTQNHKCVWAFHNKDLKHISAAKQSKQRRQQAGTEQVARRKQDAEAVSKLKALLKEKFK